MAHRRQPATHSRTAPDPLAGAWRAESNGWIVARITGDGAQRGYQYGYLLAPEIDDAIKTMRWEAGRNPATNWAYYRKTAQTLFWPKLDPEYQQEIEGIARGVEARGYTEDATDVLAENSDIEISDYYIPWLSSKQTGLVGSGAPMACSAFVATGGWTADHKIVMGQNFWWSYLEGERFKLLLNVVPSQGHEFLMDTLPGLIDSATDWAINKAGIMVTETTIGGFKDFDPNGVPEFMRMRKAVQYSDSLANFVKIISAGNNGGYANTWLLGDLKTNEIGKLQLGLTATEFDHTADGAYYSANYAENPKIIAQECYPGAADNPSCTHRAARWQQVLNANKGHINAELARSFLEDTTDGITGAKGATGTTLCGKGGFSGACNAKVTTSALAAKMQTWARMNIPDGESFSTASLAQRVPGFADGLGKYLKDMNPEPWTLFTAGVKPVPPAPPVPAP